jgi:phosphoribosylaminoimidazole-succinocarboxamide synthase
MKTVYRSDLKDLRLLARGKVRDIYDLGKYLLIVATDRISAFDVVFNEPVPYKGAVLTQLSKFWFTRIRDIVNTHFVTCDVEKFPLEVRRHAALLAHRSMLVHKAEPLKVECVVRGYLDGSAWKDYHKTSSVCGIELPPGLHQKQRLPEPIYTPATKARSGHDINISYEKTKRLVGDKVASYIRTKSLMLYSHAHEFVLSKGLVLSDTKFEFGMRDEDIILIDECLTPDSSRFWMRESYRPGADSISLDKQYVRDYLEQLGWDKNPPPPPLPQKVIKNTSERYRQAYKMITGKEFNLE